MPKWTDYTIKTDPADKDELMILDTIGKVNKRLGMSALSDFITNKVTGKKFDNLSTTGKTILGAINEVDGNEKQLKQRVDNISNLPDGSTKADAELVDIRVGADGVTYPSAGEAVREQFKGNDEKINSLKEDVSTKITKFYASNQGETHLADSDNDKIMDMMVYGKSEQKQYSGKNLLNATLETTTKDGMTCRANSDGTYMLNGTSTSSNNDKVVIFAVGYVKLPSGTYKVTGCPSGGSNRRYNLRIGKDTPPFGEYVSTVLENGYLLTLNAETLITINIMGYDANNALFKPMIVDASLYPDTTYDDFEPYTGGQPSPSPDYPQEIKSVVNPTVKVCGKNLLQNNGGKNIESNGITYIKQDDGSVVANGVSNAVSTYFVAGNFWDNPEPFNLTPGNYSISAHNYNNTFMHAIFYNKRKEIIWDIKSDDKASATLSNDVASEIAYINFYIRIQANTTAKNMVFYPQLELGSTPTAYEPYHEQTVTLPYDLYGIKVTSGGNVTIDGQQYVSDYVDVERGKLVRCVGKCNGDNMTNVSKYGTATTYQGWTFSCTEGKCAKQDCVCSHLILIPESQHYAGTALGISHSYDRTNLLGITLPKSIDSVKQYFIENNVTIFYQLETPIEIDLTEEEIAALKALTTYYPTTNISVNSEQLDGYTVFNYPISMENGWNYVKQQIGDTRDYIYDMDARTQDTDLQAAEAYVNSEYAVALTELEVM